MSLCPQCGEPILTGCTCGWKVTDGFTPQLGNDSDTVELVPRVDAISGNLIACGASGLEAILADRFTNPPRVRVYNSSNQAVDATPRHANFDSEDYDAFGMHDASTSALNPFLVIPIAGLWKIGYSLRWSGSGTGYRQAFIYVNRHASVLNRFAWSKEKGRTSGNKLNIESEGSLQAGDIVSIEVASTVSVNLQASGIFATSLWASFKGDLAA